VTRLARARARARPARGARLGEGGFTLLELIVVAAIVVLLLALTIPNLREARSRAYTVACDVYRGRVEQAESVFLAKSQRHSTHPRELVTTGVLDREHPCPGGGLYAWWPYEATDRRYQTRYGCSTHAKTEGAVPGPAVEDPPLFHDDFAGGGDKWRQTAGKPYTIKDGWLSLGPGGNHMLFGGDPTWGDGTLSFSGMLQSGKGFGTFFRATDTGKGKPSGYSFEYDSSAKQFRLTEWTAGRESKPFATAPAPNGFSWSGTSRDFEIEMRGDLFTVRMNGQQILTGRDSTYRQGGIGLETWGTSVARFDSVSFR
jgi:prepilin-type N-terminal cleavage/methylation domain-containing protein